MINLADDYIILRHYKFFMKVRLGILFVFQFLGLELVGQTPKAIPEVYILKYTANSANEELAINYCLEYSLVEKIFNTKP